MQLPSDSMVYIPSDIKVYLSCTCLCIYTGGVVKDQAEADKDTNLKQRTALAIGMLIPKAHMQHYNG